jgi:hypothetical protein
MRFLCDQPFLSFRLDKDIVNRPTKLSWSTSRPQDFISSNVTISGHRGSALTPLSTGRVTATEMGSIPAAKGEPATGVKAPLEPML